jgi:hypothetical protein
MEVSRISPIPSKKLTEPPKTSKKPTKKPRISTQSKTAKDFRSDYEQILLNNIPDPDFEIEEMFPLGLPGGTPLLIWNGYKPKFVLVLGAGSEKRIFNIAHTGNYEKTGLVECHVVFETDPPVGTRQELMDTLFLLTLRLKDLWENDYIENIGVVCYAGQNRSVSTLLLFLMLMIYTKTNGESTKDFAIRILTIITASRPGAFYSIKDVRWKGMDLQSRGFKWFELVINTYNEFKDDTRLLRNQPEELSLKKLVIF